MGKHHETVDHSRDADALREAFGREGCPVCTVTLDSMDSVMSSWNYEGFTDVEHRFEVIRTRGFCPQHTWQLAQRDNAFQLAVIYREILTDVQQNLEHIRAAGERHVWGAKWFGKKAAPAAIAPDYARCPFCRRRAEIEDRIAAVLISLMAAEEARAQLAQSTGLCLPHFAQVYGKAQTIVRQRADDLLACQQACMQRTLDELSELVRKHDYRFHEEQRGGEMTSWRRAAELLVGNPGLR